MAGGQQMNPAQWATMGAATPLAMQGMGMFGNNNPAHDAMGYFNQIPGQVKPYYDPYIQAGQRQLPGLESQYGQLQNDPGGRLNQIGQSYHQSPGFQFALQQALQGSGHAAAAGGMAGSPQHEQQNMELATNLGNQDYNQYMQNALGLYGMGMQGGQHLYDQGYNASNEMGQTIGNNLQSQGSLAYNGRQQQMQSQGDTLGAFANLASLAAFL
jgi:hypothetical protein